MPWLVTGRTRQSVPGLGTVLTIGLEARLTKGSGDRGKGGDRKLEKQIKWGIVDETEIPKDSLEEVATKSFEITCTQARYGEAYNTAIRARPGYCVNHWT